MEFVRKGCGGVSLKSANFFGTKINSAGGAGEGKGKPFRFRDPSSHIPKSSLCQMIS